MVQMKIRFDVIDDILNLDPDFTSNVSIEVERVLGFESNVVSVDQVWNKFKVNLIKGDCPRFGSNGEVIIVVADNFSRSRIESVSTRQVFSVNDFARLLHTFACGAMERAAEWTRQVSAREEMDSQMKGPWEQIAEQFNKENYHPVAVSNLRDGILISHISSVDPTYLVAQRTPELLKEKMAWLKSEYGVLKENFPELANMTLIVFPILVMKM